MHRRSYLTLFLLLAWTLNTLSGQSTIRGTITAQDQPQNLATVQVEGTNLGSVTDKNGSYTLNNVPDGKRTLLVSSLGFKTLRKILIIKDQKEYIQDFKLAINHAAIDEVVISGTLKPVSRSKSPIPVAVYSKSFFKKNPTPSLFESIQNINGVRSQLNCNVCNTGDIHINGLEGPYTFVLIDGMPIVSGLSTVYGLTGIPQFLIERVEIVKGPAATLYGSEAVGGVINIITKKPSNAPLLALDSFASSWGELNTDLGLKYRLGKKTQGLLGVNYFNYQNPVDNNGDGFTDLTLQHRISAFHKFVIPRKNQRVFTLGGRYVYEDRWGGAMDWNSDFRGSETRYGESIYTSRWETFGTYQLPLKEKITFQFSANGHIQNSFYGSASFNADQYIGFAQLFWDKKIGTKNELLFGAAYRYTYYDDNTFATLQSNGLTNMPSKTHLPSIFVQDQIGLNSQHQVVLGGRYDYNSLHGNILSPRINYKWNSKDNRTLLRMSLGNGFRVANIFTEDHAALTGARDVVFEDVLKPETSWNANLNFVKKITTKNDTFIEIDAAAFYTHFSNRILPDYETDPNKIIYGNLNGKSVSQGIAVNADIVWPGGLKLLAGATLMDVSITENEIRKRQLLTESFSSVWSISYAFGDGNFSIDYTGNLYGPMRLPLLGPADPRDEYSPWYSLQNIQCTKKLGETWEVYAGIKNILNFTPPSNSIARPFDPFDLEVDFDEQGQALATPNNPYGLTFDPTYVYASNQGIRGFFGLRYTWF